MDSFTTVQAGLWGAVGAAGSLLLLFVLPAAYALATGKAQLTLTPSTVVGASIVLVATLFLGAMSSVLLGTTELKTAIAAGLAYQSTLAGAVKSYLG